MRIRIAMPWLLCALATVTLRADADPLRDVDPFIGTGGHGHTFPGPSMPFGMVQLGPDTRLEGWDGCSGYHFDDDRIFGFSHTHLSGTGVGDYCDILLLPGTGRVQWRSSWGRDAGMGYGSRFRKSTERASPGFYGVRLDDYGTTVELTVTPRAGMHRYTFPRGEDAWVLIDLAHRDEVLESSLRVVGDREVEGFRRSRGWATDQWVYFVARFSAPFAPVVAVDDSARAGARQATGRNVKAALQFSQAGTPLLVKVGISAVDIDGARRNLDAEIHDWDFDAVHEKARRTWREALARIDIAGADRARRTVFYTALYHTLLQPNLYTDADGRYRGRDGQVHHTDGWTQYTVFSLWDTFRAAHPLYTILEPARTADFVRTFLAQAREGGLLPVWELAGNETNCMIGYHAVSVIADAWAKGIRDFDATRALDAMIASAMQDGRGLAPYRELGYVPGDQESESVSKTLEYAYDDWCIAEMARALGRDADHATFLRRSQAWKNVFDPVTRLMRPKLGARFKTPFDPTEVDFHFTEANSWQYSFFVPHDVDGHIERMGGADAFVAQLDSLFGARPRTTGRDQADITGLIGQYAHGNEPSHHMAYLYSFAGQPWKTQARVRQILDSLYVASPDGLSGNEDCGQMSAWYVLGAMGFYSVTPGQDTYVIGTPLFDRATIRLPNGRRFTVSARGGSRTRPYIQSATLNGKPLLRSYLHHDEIAAGGELAFVLGPEPNRAWGSDAVARPPSRLRGEAITPVPYVASGQPTFRGHTEVTLASPQPDVGLVYTRDGSMPGPRSTPYTAPIVLDSTCTIRFAAVRDGSVATPVQACTFRRIEGNRSITLAAAPHRAYTAGGPDALIDGVRGGNDFRLGTWQGFYGVDLEAVVDLGKPTAIRRIAVGFLQDQNSWIFMPLAASFAVSTDGITWTPVGEVENSVDAHADGVVLQDLGIDVRPERPTRFLRIHARAPIECPAWHKGAGNRSFIFADEVVIE